MTDDLPKSDPQPANSSLSDEMLAYLQVYLDESEEELDSLVQALLTLEGDPRNTDALNEAFRLLHTLKGSSGMMGFEGVSQLAHELENRFELFRSGDRVLSRSIMDVMLECLDFFREFNAGLRRNESPNQNVQSLIARLADVEQSSSGTVSGPTETLTKFPRDLIDRSASTLASEGVFRVHVRFEDGLQLADLKARLIIARLAKIGEIVATDPPVDDIRSVDDLPQFAVAIMSDQSAEEIQSLADVDGVASVEIMGASLQDIVVASGNSDADHDDDETENEELKDGPKFMPGATMFADFLSRKQEHDRQSTPDETTPRAIPASKPATNKRAIDRPLDSITPTNPSEAPAVQSESARAAVTETVRVEIDRLDRLMNLTGELVVTQRFNRVSSDMQTLCRGRKSVADGDDISDRMRRRVQEIRDLCDSLQVNGLDHILRELEVDLAALEEQSAIWEQVRRHFADIADSVDQLNRVSGNLQSSVLQTRMVQVAPLFNRFRRVIRDLSAERNKSVQLTIRGEKTELDKRMIDELGDPLIHLVRNSIDHGLESPDRRRSLGKPETGTITLEASQSGNNVLIRVHDDGAGLNVDRIRQRAIDRELITPDAAATVSDQQILEFIWHPGFSTAEKVTDISGRGVGMDIVRNRILDLNGTIEVDTSPDEGTTFTIRLPLTLAIIRSLLLRFDDGAFSVPIDDVREIVSVALDAVFTVHSHRSIDVRGEFVPLMQMDDVFRWSGYPREKSPRSGPSGASAEVSVVILQSGHRMMGLCVDELLGGSDVVIKSLSDNFIDIRGLSGASVMGDGSICLMLDTNALIELATERMRPTTAVAPINH